MQAGKEERDFARAAQLLLEKTQAAEDSFIKTVAANARALGAFLESVSSTLPKTRGGTKMLLETVKELSNILYGSINERVDLHQKLCVYLASIVSPKLKKLIGSLETDEKMPRAELGQTCREIVSSADDIKMAKEELGAIHTELKGLRQEIGKAGAAENKALEKQLNAQVKLSVQLYEKELQLDKLKQKLHSFAFRSMPTVRTQVIAYREGDMTKQAAICDCIGGFVAFGMTFWQQCDAAAERLRKTVAALHTEEASNEILSLFDLQKSDEDSKETPKRISISERATKSLAPITIRQKGKPDAFLKPETDKEPKSPTPAGKEDMPFKVSRRLSPRIAPIAMLEAPPPLEEAKTPVKSAAKTTTNTPRVSYTKSPVHIPLTVAMAADPNNPFAVNPTTENEKSAEEVSGEDHKEEKEQKQPSDSWLYKKFGVADPLIESYTCAVSWKILLHGRMYLTKSKLCFHSLFNNSTLFGGETKIVIPLEDVVHIEKKKNALIFNNSISVKTKTNEIFFTSFVYRDRAFEQLEKCLKEVFSGQDEEFKSIISELKNSRPLEHNIEGGELNSAEKFLREVEAVGAERLNRVKDADPDLKDDSNYTLDAQMEYDAPIQVIFPSLMVSSHRIFKKFSEISGSINYVPLQETNHPDVYTSYKHAMGVYLHAPEEEREKFLQRCKDMPLMLEGKDTYVHIFLNKLPIPFFPDRCTIVEENKFYYVSPNYVIMHCKSTTKGVPFCDYFYSHTMFHFKQKVELTPEGGEKYKTRLTVYDYNDFYKSTMFKGKINSEAHLQIKVCYQDQANSLLVPYTTEEVPRFLRVVDNIVTGSGKSVAEHIPGIPHTAIGAVVLGEMRAKRCQLESMNKVLLNQKKAFMTMIMVAVLLFSLLVFIYFRI